ncbi:hypothetical protein CAEBREN_19865 [Caenorhabditis brenneri]|uniref:Uncharacterized protein n=1 Tax=Caenorhabditis brenneri TaxID=135651 RepID=G0PB71_CAEBE|nr:hypothetical protein CAEBREN_19865 [Caenorhabditis brenneri]
MALKTPENKDRLKTKALDKKCRVLVEQNEQLMARLCELEMSHGGAADEAKTRRLADQDERIRQISSALESERDVSQRLREAKEVLEKELMSKRKQEEQSQNRQKMDVEMSRMQAQNQVDEMSVEVEAARKKVTEVMAEVEQLRATNFDLQMHIETAKRTMEELADSNEQLEKQIEKAEEEIEEKDEDLKQSTWDVETLTRQNEAFRVELDGIRQGFQDTRELSEEVKQLKTELQRQQEVHRAQFEAACSQLDDSEVPERKTSLEVQQEQYILAYEDKVKEMSLEIEGLKRELELKNGPVQRKTTAVLEPPRIEEIHVVQQVQLSSAAPEAQNPAPEPSVTQNLAPEPSPELIQAHNQLKLEIEALRAKNEEFAAKMQRVELEAKLSGELNVELGRAMLELEEHNELLRKEQAAVTADDAATGRELELHVMMVQEMTEQIATMQERIDEIEENKKELLEQVEKFKGEAITAQQETQKIKFELDRAIHNLGELEVARKQEFNELNAAHDAEIRKFSIKMEDARREIADLEAKLQADREIQRQETRILTQTAPKSPISAENAQNLVPISIQTASAPSQDHGAQNAPISITEPILAQNEQFLNKNPAFLAQSAPNSAPGPQILVQDAPGQLAPHQGRTAPNLTQEPQILAPGPQNSAPNAPISPILPPETQSLLQNVTADMNRLIELKDELEIAVSALKSEIWTLNGQLKASILDRETLEDRVTELDDLMEKEKKRAIALDVELQEQVDLTERAVRRAAEAENESNQRMAECLEKETRREEIEQAYTRLNEYYNQLQEAYNTIYAQLAEVQAQNLVPHGSDPQNLDPEAPAAPIITPEDPNVSRILENLMTVLLISRDPLISLNLQEKLEKIAEKLKLFIQEYDEQQKALEEQRRITAALEERLQTQEAAGGEANTTSRRVEELEGEIEWKEEECEALKRRIRDLEKALEAVAERADEGEAVAVSRLSTELAILAARLTTRQADVDSLFRTNAELAHTNVRLQNEIDEQEEWKLKVLEEKEQLEQHVKELEEQVAELMEQHEAHLQQTQLLQSSTPILSTETTEKLKLSENEVLRLSAIEKTLNNRILALEDQNLELEEKYQEIEEEIQEIRAENAQKSKNPTENAENAGWDDDDWGENSGENAELQEAKTEVGRLLEVEKALTMRMEMLRLHNEQLEQKVEDLERKVGKIWPKTVENELFEPKIESFWTKVPTAPAPPKPDAATTSATEVDDDWGWGEESEEKPSTAAALIDTSELQEAKTEVTRLTQIEKVLNNRILALEEQNMELEERLQELEDELAEEKSRKAEKSTDLAPESKEVAPESVEEEAGAWDDWGEERDTVVEDTPAPQAPESTEHLQRTVELEKTVAELQERVRFQKEVIEKAEQELIETQDKYDELSEAYEQAQQAQNPNEQLLEQLSALKSHLDEILKEKEALRQKLTQIEAEKLELEQKIVELTAKNEENDVWNDDGWGEEKEDNREEEEVGILLRLAEQFSQLQAENVEIRTQMTAKTAELVSDRLKLQQKLEKTIEELETVKKELAEATSQAQKASTDGGWNDDSDWTDNGEIERMRETQTLLEMKIEALQEELIRVKEREMELTDENASLQSRLQSLQSELDAAKIALEEAQSSASATGGWNDEDAWNQDSEETTKKSEELESEIDRLTSQVGTLESRLLALQSAPAEIQKLQNELKMAQDQNGLLKDSEARLLDHADEFAQQMEKYREKCLSLEAKIRELEARIQEKQMEEQAVRVASDELVTLRQQLATAQQESRRHQSTISDREGQIAELRLQISAHTKTIEDLQLKIRHLSAGQRRHQATVPAHQTTTVASSSAASRPSSRLSTASRLSTSSSFVPEAMSVPLQSSGSAFDVVVPQSGEPLRRRNK